ncbi:MAG: SprT-like domain-containing protein, partial [Muribaculaceae bacterium]|nr:SprT-like domain-containing protein [Muribaculaceae bacterium]
MCKKRNIYTIAELNLALMACFNKLNEDFFGGELEKVIITIEEGYKKHAYGWIEVKKNWIQGKEERHQINISSDFLNRDIEDVIATLLHEMCHLYALQNDIKDTSRSGIYHNKKFAEIAKEHGLDVFEESHIGHRTKCSEQLRKWCADNCTITQIRVHKKKSTKADKESKPKQSSRKYICPECGLIVRATKECNI